ncbi:Neurofilament heavy protein [Hirschfeldia incana]|nr:Neurofilament heavy protein [Hirschfeldia incana]
MEEFEHMIVEEFNEEDFYETIEAPKFVDLTAPDHRPEGDDRYWFCSRVGCDQKHEEFMDSEAIYKNFVLRVMAARSPSVRLRKALYRKDFSAEIPKCPNTVPAKPSRSRVSRLAIISSIPHKANGGNMRPKEAKAVPTRKNATPHKAKAVKGKEESSVPQKALTERKKKQMQSPAGFRSVQHPRPAAATRAAENRVVAKALVFASPKKLVKLKRSVELSSSVKKLCSGMRKLEVESKRKGLGVSDKVGTSTTPSKKPLRTREVKSRVFDSVLSQKQIGEKVKGSSTLKRRVEEKKEPVLTTSNPLKSHEAKKTKEHESQLLVENKSEENAADNALALDCDDKENAVVAYVDREDTCPSEESKAKQCETTEIDEDKENALALDGDDKENVTNAAEVDAENDDKENASALDNNRKVDQSPNPLLKKKVFGRKETCKTTQKAMAIADKCNGKTVSANPHVKYTKPKLTNPKPFRLRTDERRILKEANAEKKPLCALAKEEETTNILGLHAENIGPKHQTFRLENTTTSRLKAFRGTSATLVRHDASGDMMNSKRVASGTKKQVAASKRVVTMEETSLMNGESKGAAIINNKPSVCAVASGEKRHATVPKGPNFHSVHVPKSCAKRVASHV